MAYAPIAFTIPNYRDFKNYWLKAYEPGTTTSKALATDADGATLAAKLQLDKDGFPTSDGTALVIPFISGSYDLYAFPTAGDADNNDTANALRLADDLTGVSPESIVDSKISDLSQAYEFATVAEYKAFATAFPVGKIINLLDRGASFTIIAGTGTANTFSIIASDEVSQSAQLIVNEGVLNIKHLGAKANDVGFDNRDVMFFAQTLVVESPHIELVFPAGIYTYSESPNWAIQDAVITASGEVILDYTGTDKAVIIDADAAGASSPTSGQVYNLTMGYFLVRGIAATSVGIYVESIHHSDLGFKYLGGSTSGRGFEIGFSVVTVFRSPTVSVNVGGWFGGNRPATGMYLRERGASETPSYNLFENPIIEGCVTGIHLVETLGCVFQAGTSEANLDNGIISEDKSQQNKFYGMDLEANAGLDIVDNGKRNEYYNIDTTSPIVFEALAQGCKIVGGMHGGITVSAGAQNCLLSNFGYNRQGFATGLFVSSDSTRMSNLTDLTTSLHHDALPDNQNLAVSSSPFGYTNSTANNVILDVRGGTVSSMTYTHAGVADVRGEISGAILLYPNDSLSVAFSAAPNIREYKG